MPHQTYEGKGARRPHPLHRLVCAAGCVMVPSPRLPGVPYPSGTPAPFGA